MKRKLSEKQEQAIRFFEAALRARGVNEIPSSDIGEMAMEQLRDLDHIAFIRFMSVYQSFADIEQLIRLADQPEHRQAIRLVGSSGRLVRRRGRWHEDNAPQPPRPRQRTSHLHVPIVHGVERAAE